MTEHVLKDDKLVFRMLHMAWHKCHPDGSKTSGTILFREPPPDKEIYKNVSVKSICYSRPFAVQNDYVILVRAGHKDSNQRAST